MKYYWFFVLAGCSNGLPGPYTITETYHDVDSGKPITIILDERDCGGWDPKVSYGWELCDPKTIPRR